MRARRSADSAERDIGFATVPQTRTNLAAVPVNNDGGQTVSGVTMTTLGTGTEFGQPYIEVRCQGTATAAGTLFFYHSASGVFNPDIHAPITDGFVYTVSIGARLVVGAVPAGAWALRAVARQDGGAASVVQQLTVAAPIAAIARYAISFLPFGNSAYVQPNLQVPVALNEVVNFTIRLYSANVELGIGNIRPLLHRNVPEVVVGVGDLDTGDLMRFVAQDNAFTWSDDVTNAAWTKNGITAVSAGQITEDSATATQHRLSRSVALPVGVHTLSTRVSRAVGTRDFQLGLSGGALVARAYFNLGTGQVGAVDQGTAAITTLPGGDFLVSLTATLPTATTYSIFRAMTNGTTIGSETYNGDGTSSLFVGEAQINAGPLAAYNPTTTAAISLTAANSGFTSTYYDQTGNARHLTQATAANQPSGLTAGAVATENGRAILSCDNVNDVLSSAAGVADAVMGGKPFTATHITFGSNASFGWAGNGPNGAGSIPRLYLQRAVYAYNNNGTVVIGAASGGRVLSFTHDGVTTASARRDGVLMGTGTEPVIPTFGGGGHLSVPLFSGGVAQAGGFAEFVAFSQLLTTQQFQQLERNIGAYYGVTVS
jgi:hypothetical protein